MPIDYSSIGSGFHDIGRAWRFFQQAMTMPISTGNFRSPDAMLSGIVPVLNTSTRRKPLIDIIGVTNDIRDGFDRFRKALADKSGIIVQRVIPDESGGLISRGSIDVVLGKLDAQMRRDGATVSENSTSITQPNASANNVGNIALFISGKTLDGQEDNISYEMNQSLACGGYWVDLTSPSRDGRHTLKLTATRGIKDVFDIDKKQTPQSFTFSTIQENYVSSESQAAKRMDANLISNSTLMGSANQTGGHVFHFARSSGGSIACWSSLNPLLTSPNMPASSFCFRGNGATAGKFTQSIPFNNSSSTKFMPGDTVAFGLTFLVASGVDDATEGAVYARFVGSGDSDSIAQKTINYTYKNDGVVATGGFMHISRSVAATRVELIASSALNGRVHIYNLHWGKIKPDTATGLTAFAMLGDTRAAKGDRWSSGSVSNNESGKLQTMFSRVWGAHLSHTSSTPSMPDWA